MVPTAAAAAAADATDKTTTADSTQPTDHDDGDSLIRSEVHQALPTTTASNSSGLHLSIYRFALPEQEEEDNGSTHNTHATIATAPLSLADTDEDLIVPRLYRTKRITIKLHHQRATSLDHVGLQCWRGALLLCETLLSRRKEIAGKVLCELGVGVGIASILAARLQPHRIYLTDKNDAAILDLARRNVALNCLANNASSIIVQALDWSAAHESEIMSK